MNPRDILIPKFDLTECLYESPQSLIFRANHADNGTDVILKVLNIETPRPEIVARFKREYKIADKLGQVEGGLAEELIGQRRRWVMCLKDIGGDSLDKILAKQRLSYDQVLHLSIKIAKLLEVIHGKGVIHKDINPSNIVWNQTTGEVNIIDFGTCKEIAVNSSLHQRHFEGTLAYSSPEQTGRVSGWIDHRTDFYSLGVTMFEMLTGELPFQTTDAMELVHSHVAKELPLVSDIVSEIPTHLPLLIQKLLAKRPEDRYQSCMGLLVDLTTCLEWHNQGHKGTITLGERDVSERLLIPDKLYGRQAQLNKIDGIFAEAMSGSARVILISGDSGIGKSELVEEAFRLLHSDSSFIMRGKFEQVHQDLPFAPLIQAFETFVKQILTEDDRVVNRWKQRFKEATGDNLSLITELIPSLIHIVGQPPRLPPVPVLEARNRFELTLKQFFQAMLTDEQTLVLFLDDLQWADAASLNLLSVLLQGIDNEHFLLIATYRSEVARVERFQTFSSRLKEQSIPVESIELSGLTLGQTEMMIADVLRCDRTEVKHLSELCFEKTMGNPFFLKQFLYNLYQTELLSFDLRHKRWFWDVKKIYKREFTANVIQFLTERLVEMGQQAIELAKTASAFGNTISLANLAAVLERSPDAVADGLWPLLKARIILPKNSNYDLIQDWTGAEVVYGFAHDRIQQAAYGLLPDATKAELHLKIARLLDNKGVDVFQTVNHYCKIDPSQVAEAELIKIIKGNIQAARKARESGAYNIAVDILDVTVEYLTRLSKQAAAQLEFELFFETGQCHYLIGNIDTGEKYLDRSLSVAPSNNHKAQVLSQKVNIYINLSQVDRALEIGIRSLELVGVDLAKSPSKLQVLLALVKTKLRLRATSIEDLADRPLMTDPKSKTAIEVLVNLLVSVYSASPELFAEVILKIVSISLKKGNHPLSTYGYGGFGVIQAVGFGKYHECFRFGQALLKISERYDSKLVWGRAHFQVGALIWHWGRHARENLDHLKTACRFGVESGDFLNVSLATINLIWTRFFLGQPLDYVREKAIKYLGFAENLAYNDLELCHSAIIRVVQLLEGSSDDEESEQAFMDEIRQCKYTSVYAGYLIHRMLALYILGRHDDVAQLADEASQVLHGIAGTIIWPDFYFIQGLNSLRLSIEGKVPKTAQKSLAKLKVWAQASPANYQVKALFLEGEIQAKLGQFNRAFELYEQANLAAKEGGFLHLEAMINEQAAKFWLAQGHEDYANIKMSLAYRAFAKWGAAKKNKQLMATYPYIINTQLRRRKFTGKESHSGIETAQTFSETFDLATVMKSIQAISEKLVLEDLITEMLSIVVENAGAQSGHLLLPDRADWHIEASYNEEDDKVWLEQRPVLPHSTEIPYSILQYVGRTKQSLVIHNAQQQAEFSADEYIRTKSPKSILCLVLLRQELVIGILYLENNKVIGAFTEERLQFMDLLSNQIAIAIDHAKLYANLENKVHERTAIIKRQHTRLEEQKKELDRQIAIAKTIQENLLPGRLPYIDRIEIAYKFRPMMLIGGDFLDILYDRENERIGFFMCDVSGHGVHAAMLAAMVKVSLHSWSHNLDKPVEVLEQIRTLLKGKMAGNFITASIGCIDLKTGQMSTANAGHSNLCLIRNGGGTELVNPKGRLIVSWLELDCEEETHSLYAGDKIVLFTDGLHDVQSKHSGTLGEARFMKIIETHRNRPPHILCDAVFGEVGKFFEGREQNDDLTFMVLEYKGGNNGKVT